MTNMFIFLYVEEENVWLQENMYALKHAWMHYAIEIFKEVQQNFKVAQDRHKSYAELKRTWREFNIWWSCIPKGKSRKRVLWVWEDVPRWHPCIVDFLKC